MRRGLRYAAYLLALEGVTQQVIPSPELARLTGGSAALVRQDILRLGQALLLRSDLPTEQAHLGRPGVGYECTRLREALRWVLGVAQPRRVAVRGEGEVASDVRAQVQDCQYFVLVKGEETADFAVLVGAGPFSSIPSGARVLYWQGDLEAGIPGTAGGEATSLLQLLLALSSGLER